MAYSKKQPQKTERGMLGKHHSEATKEKISKALKGRNYKELGREQMSGETKKKMSVAHVGRFKGEESWCWKGDRVGYDALHDWINRILGVPYQCSFCGMSAQEKRLDWASKRHLYTRKLKDWISLCRSCHMKYDNDNRKLINNYANRATME